MDWACPIPDKHRDPRLWRLDNLLPVPPLLLSATAGFADAGLEGIWSLPPSPKRLAIGFERAHRWVQFGCMPPFPLPEAHISESERREMHDELCAGSETESEEENSESGGLDVANESNVRKDSAAVSETKPVAIASPSLCERRTQSSAPSTPSSVLHSPTRGMEMSPPTAASSATREWGIEPTTPSRPRPVFILSPHARSWIPGRGLQLALPQRVLDAPPLVVARRSVPASVGVKGYREKMRARNLDSRK